MDIIEKVKDMTDCLAEDKRCLRLQAACAAVDTNEELQRKLMQLNDEKEALVKAMKDQSVDQKDVNVMRKEYDNHYTALLNNPLIEERRNAQNEMNALITQINTMVQRAVSGDASCGSDCSHCQGCH
ncbi:MAG TPA: hypothetical protein DEP42_00015 [Ruminococcaceae bacterium]|nr:hypothetical protein [Oscillospiraceae bacterium]